jgi:hypothetical protein
MRVPVMLTSSNVAGASEAVVALAGAGPLAGASAP